MSWSTHITMIASNDYTPDSPLPENAKNLYFRDRSAAFSSNLDALLDLASIGSLLFISDCGLENWDSEDWDSEDLYEDESRVNKWVLINHEKSDVLIADIDKLFLWCSNNLATTSTVFEDNGYDEEDVRQGMERAVEYETYHYDGEASSEPDFLFCVIKSIQALLKYAKENNTTVFYNNLAE